MTSPPVSAARGDQRRGGRTARTVRVLRTPNFRRYYLGQTISLIGTWAQSTGQIWLVMKVLAPNDGTMLGVTAAFQSAPILLTLWGGSLADGMDKRRLLVWTQSLSALLAAALGLATLSGHVSLPFVWFCAAALGLVNSADAPTRQAIVPELVDEGDVPSAIALNSASYQAMRAVGVAVAPISVALWGYSAPFLVNAVSFLVVIGMLLRLDTSRMRTVARARRRRPPVREGLAAIAHNAGLAAPVAGLSLVAVLALNFNVTLPLFATHELAGGLGTVSELLAASSMGAVAASLCIAGLSRVRARIPICSMALLAATMAGLALAPDTGVAIAIMVVLGASIATTTATVNTLLQSRCGAEVRGRVMSVYSLIMQGSSLIGGPLVGLISDQDRWGAGGGLYVGAGGALAGAIALGLGSARRRSPAPGAPDRADGPG